MQLAVHRLEGRRPGPRMLITGGVHGDEFEPMAAVRRLIAEIPPDDLRGRLTLIPVVNEPAFRRGQRTGDDGLDLARTCPGRPDGSPTEQIAHALSAHIREADYYIDLHTGGTRLQVLPLVGYVLHPDADILEKQRQMAHAFGLPIIWGTDPGLDGRSLSIARDAKVPALYAEYLGGGLCDSEGIEKYVAGCLNVLALLKMMDRPVRPPEKEPLVIEDSRPQSGHLQINHLSPVEGFFAPAVTLGDRIQKGDLFGTVLDPLGRNPVKVQASRTGIVLVLHTFARVDRGSSLGVILETE